MYLYDSNKSFFNAKYNENLRRNNGIEAEVITAGGVLKHRPNLKSFECGTNFFPNASSIDHPGKVIKIFFQKLTGLGVKIYSTYAVSINENDQNDIKMICTDKVFKVSKSNYLGRSILKDISKVHWRKHTLRY
ncbi:hypothetical protein OAA72_06905 [Amylibacter sp.]|nr:hypothetical protein [Amylibacter sp.]